MCTYYIIYNLINRVAPPLTWVWPIMLGQRGKTWLEPWAVFFFFLSNTLNEDEFEPYVEYFYLPTNPLEWILLICFIILDFGTRVVIWSQKTSMLRVGRKCFIPSIRVTQKLETVNLGRPNRACNNILIFLDIY